MDAAEFIAACRQAGTVPPALASQVAYASWLDGYVGIPEDIRLPFRTAVVEALLPDFSLADRSLILHLFAEELACERGTGRPDNLYQLSYYLYELGQLADCFLLFEAKFQTTNFDTGSMLDREAMTVGHSVAEVIAYVESAFAATPALRARYPTMLAELHDLLAHPDYDSPASYQEYLRIYFRPDADEAADDAADEATTDSQPLPSPASQYEPQLRPWWKFW